LAKRLICSEAETRVIDLANWINGLTGNEAGVVFKPIRDWNKVVRRRASIEKAKKILGYKPKTDIKVGLEKTYKWKAREMAVTRRIQLANAETIQLAREANANVLLADENEVRELAAEFGLEVRGCLGLLVEAVRRQLISINEAEQDAERLMEEGYRISEEVLKKFHDVLRTEESK
jgi:predicted nucleic acid-binding protein